MDYRNMADEMRIEIQRLEEDYGAEAAYPTTSLLLQARENLLVADRRRAEQAERWQRARTRRLRHEVVIFTSEALDY